MQYYKALLLHDMGWFLILEVRNIYYEDIIS